MKKNKKNNKKKLPRFALGTMAAPKYGFGYHQAKQLGDSTFLHEPGQSLYGDVKTAKLNMLPFAMNKASQNIITPAMLYARSSSRPMPAASTTSTLSSGLPTIGGINSANSIASSMNTYNLANAGANAIGSASALMSAVNSVPTTNAITGLPNVLFTGGGTHPSIAILAANRAAQEGAKKLAEKGVEKTGTSFGLVALPALGVAIGGALVAQDIANAGDPGVTQLQIANSAATNTYTTAGGSTYKERTGIDVANARELERLMRNQKLVGLTMDAAGLGMSAGTLAGTLGAFGSTLGPWGSVIGLGVGALAGGLASLLGFGDNSDEVEEMIKNQLDVFAMQNKQNRSIARDQDVRSAFYERGAANGKNPGGKAVAMVGGKEVAGQIDPITGALEWMSRIPGKRSTTDNRIARANSPEGIAAASESGFIASNKAPKGFKEATGYKGISDYIWNTGDVQGGLAWLDKMLEEIAMKHKNGKLPKYDKGTPNTRNADRALARQRFADYANMIIPGAILAGLYQQLVNEDRNANVYAPDVYAENPEGTRAVNALARLRFDADPYYREAMRGLNLANWEARRNVGLGIGGRAVALNANFMSYLRSLGDITKIANEALNSYAEKYATALAQLGSTNLGRRMEAAAKRHQWLQLAQAAKFNAYRTDLSMIPQILAQTSKDLYGISKQHSADDYRNKMVGMHNLQLANEKQKIAADIENAIANRQLAAKMFNADQENKKNNTSTATPTYVSSLYTPGVGNQLFMPQSYKDFVRNPFRITLNNPFAS